jgi:hypothetical protein
MNNNNMQEYNSADFQESHFGIRNKEDMKHIFNVMRNKIYSNKILAVLREYSTNACDAHIESGQRTRPIQVTLPTIQNRFLTIRDFGSGLSEDDIRNIYTMYGASTKRGSTELNGQLGFGSKAAFSYADSFTITSYYNGYKVVYEAYVDETGLGAISQIEHEPTIEPSGIKISIAVQLNDIGNFCDTAIKLYQHFQVIPEVLNLGDNIQAPDYILRKDSWGLRASVVNSTTYHREENVVIMGNVAYPINLTVLSDNFRNHPKWYKYAKLMECPINFYVPVGKMSIAASREALEYDKKTLHAFQEIFDIAIQEIDNELNARIGNARDIVEAKQYYKLIAYGELRALNSIISTALVWNDQPITDYRFVIPGIYFEELRRVGGEEFASNMPAFTTRLFERLSYTEIPSSKYISIGTRIEVNDENKLFIQDTDDKPILRIRKFLLDNPDVKKIYLFKLTAHTSIENIATESTIPISYFNSLAAQTPLVIERGGTGAPHNIKHSRKIFQLANLDNHPFHPFNESEYWDQATIDSNQQYYYVYLDHFKVKFHTNSDAKLNRHFRSSLNVYERLTDTDISTNIIGVKINAAERIEENWQNLHSLMRTNLENILQNNSDFFDDIALQTEHARNNIVQIIALIESGHLHADSPLRQFHTRLMNARSRNNHDNTYNTYIELTNLCRQLNLDNLSFDQQRSQSLLKIENEINELSNRYPLLRWSEVSFRIPNHDRFTSDLTTYIRLIDASHGLT